MHIALQELLLPYLVLLGNKEVLLSTENRILLTLTAVSQQQGSEIFFGK